MPSIFLSILRVIIFYSYLILEIIRLLNFLLLYFKSFRLFTCKLTFLIFLTLNLSLQRVDYLSL